MGTNLYFRNNGSPGVTNEQRLMEDLMIEATKIYGEDIYYIQRESEDSIDLIFGEDPVSKFEKTYHMEMFIASVEGWSDGQDFMSKFGLQINEGTTLVVPRRTWDKYVPKTEMTRPREGDLIWVPVMGYLFEIKFVEHENEYFQLGRRLPMIYELKVERYRYSQEEFDTGIDEIDQVEIDSSYTIRLYMQSGNTHYMINEEVYQGANLEASTARAQVSNWLPGNNVLDIVDINGIFLPGSNVIGANSGTSRTLTEYNDMEDHVRHQSFRNFDLEEGANTLIDTTEQNPFGMP